MTNKELLIEAMKARVLNNENKRTLQNKNNNYYAVDIAILQLIIENNRITKKMIHALAETIYKEKINENRVQTSMTCDGRGYALNCFLEKNYNLKLGFQKKNLYVKNIKDGSITTL